jgi:hypothetical protein
MPDYPDPIPVPGSSADWHEIGYFSLSFNAYDRLGGFDPVSKLAKGTKKRWASIGKLPEGLDKLRAALFFEQRSYRHSDSEPQGTELSYIHALLAAIHDQTGGSIPGPADEWP